METRRGWIAGICSFLGLTAVSKATAVQEESYGGHAGSAAVDTAPKKRGFLCHRLDVGQLPPYKAEAFCERMKDAWRKLEYLKDYDIVVIPVRPGCSMSGAITIFDFEHGCMGDTMMPEPELEIPEVEVEFKAPDKDKAKDYVLLMLGAPVVKIELDVQQLDAAYESTKIQFESYATAKKLGSINGAIDEAFKDIMLAKAMIMLGHVRNKWKTSTEAVLAVVDGKDLIEEGQNKIIYWHNLII